MMAALRVEPTAATKAVAKVDSMVVLKVESKA